jgi:nickel-dependent lactate racemase
VFSIPWQAWRGDESFALEFPTEWDVYRFPMQDAQEISDEDIKEALLSPIGSDSLRVMADGKRNVVIVVDDISRPTPAYRILPFVLDELKKANKVEKKIRIILSLGAHRPMLRQELILKLGREIWESCEIHNHHPFENLAYLGKSSMGTPIYINKFYLEADVKIALGCVLPHVYAGFGGGAKLIVPGIAGIDTLQANHQPAASGNWGLGVVDGNEVRNDMEEICLKVGLDFTINTVVNSQRQLAGVFTGDLVTAHRAGVRIAQQIYSTPISESLDVGIFNAYPKDTELFQASLALNPFLSAPMEIIKKGGVALITTASPEGGGYHSLEGYHMRLYQHHDEFPAVQKALKDRTLCIFSPNLTPQEVNKYYSSKVRFFKEWGGLVEYLKERFADKCKIGIFPCASIQLFT